MRPLESGTRRTSDLAKADKLPQTATIDGQSLTLERVIRSIGQLPEVVICHSSEGESLCASLDDWLAHGLAYTSVAGAEPSASSALVTKESTTPQKLCLFRSLFRGNEEVYAHGYTNKKTGRIGYAPVCTNEWRRGICAKCHHGTCDACQNRKFKPLTNEAVLAHLLDRDPQHRDIIGLYPLTKDSTCWFLVADFDDDGWQEAAKAYRGAARADGIPCSVERSRSGNGAHVWTFFKRDVPARDARALGTLLLDEARKYCSRVSFASYDRLFPTQDYLPKGGLGNLISLPLQRSAVERGASVFVDDELVPYPDQWAYLSSIEKVSPSTLRHTLERDNRHCPARMLSCSAIMPDTGEPLPRSKINITLDEMVTLRRADLPQSVIADAEKLSAIANPEFFRKQAMRVRVGNTPRYLWFGEEDDETVRLPRGCLDSLRNLLVTRGLKLDLHDERVSGKQIHASFVGTLRETQQRAVNALLAHDEGVLVAPTGFGKTVLAASIIAQRGVSTLVLVPRTSLVEQWHDRLEQFLVIEDEPQVLRTPKGRISKNQPGKVGQIGGGRKLPSGLVDIALPSSLLCTGKIKGDRQVASLVRDYGMVIVDEVQHVPASEMTMVLKACPARYMYGLTATPHRKDGLERGIDLLVGPIRHSVRDANEDDQVRILVPQFTGVVGPTPLGNEHSSPGDAGQEWNECMTMVSEHEGRNGRIALDALNVVAAGGSPLILTRRIDQARELAKLLEEAGCPSSLLIGSDEPAIRKAKLREIEQTPAHTRLCVIATGSYLGEGFDCPRLDTLLLAAPVSWKGLLTQFVGRIQRDYRGKRQVTVYDYIDENLPMFARAWQGRLKTYSKLGYHIAELGMGEGGPPMIEHGVVTSGKLIQLLEHDIRHAHCSILLSSEWVNGVRVTQLAPVLRDVTSRGVKVDAILRASGAEADDTHDKARNELESAGCHVIAGSPEGRGCSFAVFDQRLVWFGGLPMLAFPHHDDRSVRIVNRELAAELSGHVMQQGTTPPVSHAT